jgi:RNA-directed DNA polymerase
VLAFLRRQEARLRLRINAEKSAVARVRTRQVRGMACWRGPGGVWRRRVAAAALEALKARGRKSTGRTRGTSGTPVVEELRSDLTGGHAYCRMAETPVVFRKLDEGIRHRRRQLDRKQWNRGRTIDRELRARGASDTLARMVASGSKRWWHHAAPTIHVVRTNAHVDRLGVPRLASSPPRLEPPDADPHVRWCGRGRKATIPISSQLLHLTHRNTRRHSFHDA